MVHGRWPGDKNPFAHSACDLLWAAAGGDVDRQWNVRSEDAPPENSIWRGHMRVAKRHADGPKAKAIAAIFARMIKGVVTERSQVTINPEWHERWYSDLSPVRPADLIRAFPSPQQAADAIGIPLETINGLLRSEPLSECNVCGKASSVYPLSLSLWLSNQSASSP
jgi:hypothetical protein